MPYAEKAFLFIFNICFILIPYIQIYKYICFFDHFYIAQAHKHPYLIPFSSKNTKAFVVHALRKTFQSKL